MRISLTTLCPTCKATGTAKRLFKELGDEEVKCDAGHKFPTVEAAEAGLYVPALPDASSDVRKAAAPAPAPPQEHTRPPQAPKPSEPEPPAPETPREASQPPSMELEPVPGEGVVEADAGFELAPMYSERELSASSSLHLVPVAGVAVAELEPEIAPAVRDQRTRELILGVRIPEQHVSSLMAEAENQHEDVHAYFQRMIEFGLDARWFF